MDEKAGIRRYALDHHRGNLVASLGHQCAKGLIIVERQNHGVAGETLGNTGGRRGAEGREPGTSRYQEVIGVAVVAAIELDNGIPARGPACEPDGRHHRLGARGHEADHLEVGDGRGHEFGEFDFLPAGCSKGQTGCGGSCDRLDHIGMGVAEDQRAPGTNEIHVGVAVGVDHVAAFSAFAEERLSTDTAESSDRRVHPRRHEFAGLAVQLLRSLSITHNQPSERAMRPW